MTITEYQKLAKNTCAELGNKSLNFTHMYLGIISEFGEIADIYKKHIAYGKEFDKIHVLEEIADVVWYIANEATFLEKELSMPKAENYLKDAPSDVIIKIALKNCLSLIDPQTKLNNVLFMTKALGFTENEFYNALKNNINKLKVRFPDKFSKENALNRNLEKERQELEK